MSERTQRSRQERTSLLGGVLEDALTSLDAATPDALLAVVGAEGCDLVVAKIAERAIGALDEEDLVFACWQNRRILEASSGGAPIGEAIRRALQKVLRHELQAHLLGRAAQFRAADEAA